jgi:hypothetical protein
MYPTAAGDPDLQLATDEIYRPYLEDHFSLVAQTVRWRMYRRKQ